MIEVTACGITMGIETKKSEISNETYLAAGTGAAVFGTAGNAVLNKRLSNLAGKTLEVLTGTDSAVCDSFVYKNNKLVTKAVESKKGFFGKINKNLKKMGSSTSETIENSTKDILDGYLAKAAKKAGKNFSGEKLTEEALKLKSKLLKNDIYKSYKSASKFKNAAITGTFALFGVVAGCIAKQLIKANQKASEKPPVISK